MAELSAQIVEGASSLLPRVGAFVTRGDRRKADRSEQDQTIRAARRKLGAGRRIIYFSYAHPPNVLIVSQRFHHLLTANKKRMQPFDSFSDPAIRALTQSGAGRHRRQAFGSADARLARGRCFGTRWSRGVVSQTKPAIWPGRAENADRATGSGRYPRETSPKYRTENPWPRPLSTVTLVHILSSTRRDALEPAT